MPVGSAWQVSLNENLKSLVKLSTPQPLFGIEGFGFAVYFEVQEIGVGIRIAVNASQHLASRDCIAFLH